MRGDGRVKRTCISLHVFDHTRDLTSSNSLSFFAKNFVINTFN